MSTTKSSRRLFLKSIAASGAAAGVACSGPRKQQRPNILFFITDQQFANRMSIAGDRWLKTPALDSIARSGVRFTRAYAANPVCLPSRFSLFTGHYPSAIGVRDNGSTPTDAVNAMPRKAMGHLFRAAGYETVYGGKVHLPGPMRDIRTCGFDVLTKNQRDGCAEASVRFLRRRHDKPFLMVASFINPHDICYMAIRDYYKNRPRPPWLGGRPGGKLSVPPPLDEALKLPPGVSREEFFAKYCPPLPPNFGIPPEEPDAITWLVKSRPFRQYVRQHWSAEQWRLHRWAYRRLTERVDAQIGRVLAALHETGLEENTLVVMTSDHGDMDSAHRLEHKTVFYEGASRIPLLVREPAQTGRGRVESEHLVSNGLDLIPTLCDYAGIQAPAGLQGHSLRPLVAGNSVSKWRETLFVESQIGYMVTDGRYKYSAFDPDKGARRESLVDMKTDPGEMQNLVGQDCVRDTVHRLRVAMADWQKQNGIQFEMPS